jgi:hypothetical protein
MECIDVCKKGTEKEVDCEWEVSDTESVSSLTGRKPTYHPPNALNPL